MKKVKSVVITLFIVCPFILILARNVLNYKFCNRCIENWMGQDFITYTGQCMEVYYHTGFPKMSNYGYKSKYQYLTGQGWHLILDDGREYYIPEAPEVLEQENPPFNLEKIQALASTEVTVVCLPETTLSCLNVIVSLEVDGDIYIDESATYAYIIQAMKNIRVGAWIFLAAASPLILFGAFTIYLEIDDAITRSKKEKMKCEKMQRLREEGKLHPKKQLQKKQKNATDNKKRS